MMLMFSCRRLCWEPYRSTYLLLECCGWMGRDEAAWWELFTVVSCCSFSLLLSNRERKYFVPATQMTG